MCIIGLICGMRRGFCTLVPLIYFFLYLECPDSIEESLSLSSIQWNPSKADNFEPHVLSIVVGCPLWRGCIDVNGKTIGTQKFVHYY